MYDDLYCSYIIIYEDNLIATKWGYLNEWMWGNHVSQLLSTAEKRDTFSHYTINEKEQFDHEMEWNIRNERGRN